MLRGGRYSGCNEGFGVQEHTAPLKRSKDRRSWQACCLPSSKGLQRSADRAGASLI